MGYDLGVDLGTTYTAAAVLRAGRAEIATLGTRSLQIPSVAFLLDDGELLVGDPAERRSLLQPDRFAREFKRRIGDPTPILLGGTPFSAHALTARLLRAVVNLVAAREGGPPDDVVVTCPASWSDYKRDLLEQAIRQADVGTARLVTEPEAAAVHYASTTRVASGDVVAVYDLGGGTFDATVLRNAGDRFELLGEPQGLEHLGGVQFDDAVFAYVTSQFQPELRRLDPHDPGTLTALARLRRECVEAKEALSADTEVTIPVSLPNRQTEVRLTRPEFESMIRPALADTIETMERTLRSADLQLPDVTAVLLVGGSSRIPLIAELVASEMRRPTAVDVHPKHAVAMGAALLAGGGLAALTGPRAEPERGPAPAPVIPAPPPASVVPAPVTEPPIPEPEPTPSPSPAPPSPVPEPPVPLPEPPVPLPEPQPPIPEPGPIEPRPPVPEPVPPEPPVPEPPIPEPEPVEPVPPSPVPEPVPTARGDGDGGDGGDGDDRDGEDGDRAGPGPDRRPRRLLVAAGVVTVVAVVGALTQLGGGDGGGSGGSAATAGSCPTADAPSGGGELLDFATFGLGVPEHIDPAQSVSPQSWQITNVLYDGLTEIDSRDPENPQVVPQVAGSIRSNDDATRWTFTLREGLRFSDGEPVLPSSFVRGWERATDRQVAGQHSAVFRLIEGGAEKLDGEAETISGLTADDEAMTLEVRLAAPHAQFDAVVGFQPFMPMPRAVEDLDDQAEWENGLMVGNGPFALTSAWTGDELSVERNPEWNGTCYGEALGLPAQPALEGMTFRRVDDGYGTFAGGEGDTARIPPASLDEAHEAYTTTLESPPPLTYYLTVNWEDPVLGGPENRLLRQAISQAVDRDEINRVFGGMSTPATGVISPAMPGFAEGLCEHCSTDPEAAQDSFEQWQAAGNALSEPIQFQSIAEPGESDPSVDAIVDSLNNAGIQAVEEPLGRDEYIRRRTEGDCRICLVTVFPAYLAYDSTLYDNFHSESIGRDNFGRFSDSTFDDLVEEGRAEVDDGARVEVYRRAEQRLVNELVGTIPVLWSTPPYAVGDRVEGLTVNQLGQIAWERVSLTG